MKLKHFAIDEFRAWWPIMDPVQLRLLDVFRERWGSPVIISPVHGSLGRRSGKGDDSQHNVDRWGVVRATDVFPDEMDDLNAARAAIELAKEIGFTGVGYYPDTAPAPMLHLDCRVDRVIGDPALWGRLRGEYVSLDTALEHARRLV